jgi:lipopolysaccharide export system permease protein
MKILYKHVLKAHIGPFLFTFSMMMFLFTMQFLMRTIDQIVGKGLATSVILELIVLNLAWMVVLAVPMAVLVSTLMAFGDLTNSGEMAAIRAAGISLIRIMVPVLIAGLVMTFLVERFDNVILPDANHEARVLRTDIIRKKPGAQLKAGVFTNMFQGYSILAEHTYENSPGMKGVTIYDFSDPQKNTVITADSGSIVFTKDARFVVLMLYNGERNQLDTPAKKSYQKVAFEKYKVLIDASGYDFERTSPAAMQRGGRELSAADMIVIVDSMKQQNNRAAQTVQSLLTNSLLPLVAGTTDTAEARRHVKMLQSGLDLAAKDTINYLQRANSYQRLSIIERATSMARTTANQIESEVLTSENTTRTMSSYLVEIHKKYSIPMACFVFVLVGVPLGVLAKRGGFGVGAGLSLVFFVAFWGFLIGGEKLADRELMPPWLSMWAADILIGFIGLLLIAKVSGYRLADAIEKFRVVFKRPAK